MNNFSNQTLSNYKSITQYIRFYCLLVVLSFGMIGNIISLLIFTRPNLNKKTNTGILYTLLCVFNILTLIEEAFLGPSSKELFNIQISFINIKSVNTEIFIRTCLTEILPWIQALICFDRFILVIYPMKAHIMRKPVSLKNHIYNLITIVIVTIIFKVVLFSIIIAVITLILAINLTIYIILPLRISGFRRDMFTFEKIVIYTVKFSIPYLTMVALNIMVILRLRQSKRRVGLNSSARQTNPANSATDKGTRFTTTTILIDVIYLVFNLPYILISIYALFIIDQYYIDIIYVFVIFGNLLPISYPAALCIMFIIFNRIFRKELVVFFRLDKFVNCISPNFLNSSSNR